MVDPIRFRRRSRIFVRRPHVYAAAAGKDILSSSGGGISWSAKPLPSGNHSTIVTCLPMIPGTIYAGVVGVGIYKSVNNGDS